MIDNLSNVCKNCIDDNLKHEIVFTVKWVEEHIINKIGNEIIEQDKLIAGCARSHILLKDILNSIIK
jgi:hypothetical protein